MIDLNKDEIVYIVRALKILRFSGININDEWLRLSDQEIESLEDRLRLEMYE